MRVLFASTAGEGHFAPLVPLATACMGAGHDVVVGAPESFADTVTAAGLRHAPFADVAPEEIGQVMAPLPQLSFEEANRVVIRRVFADLDARAALPGLMQLLADWQPDLIIREPAEFGSLLAGVAAGVPQVQVAIGMRLMGELMLGEVEEPLATLAADAGIDPGKTWKTLVETPGITFVPEILDGVDLAGHDAALAEFGHVRVQWSGPTWRFRTERSGAYGALPPAWGNPDLPLVYASFGSIAGSLGPFGSIFPVVLEALADQPCRVLLTTGKRFDQSALPPLPGNAKVESWWPQADVLPHASVVVGHGGFGTTMGALVAGNPQVVVPLFTTDQVVNAVHVAAAGAGLMVPDWFRAGDLLAGAVHRVLSDPTYRRSAEEIATAIGALPTVADAVPVVEDLAAGGPAAL